MQNRGDILVIIVTHNGLEWIEGLLEPFVLDREGLRIAIVDNASTDGTPEHIERHFPFVEVIRRRVNLGFGAANNLLMERALAEGFRGVFLLNQDARIEAAAIRTLADYADLNKRVGIVSPKHLARSGDVEKGFSNYLPHLITEGFNELDFINAALWYIPSHTLERVGFFSPLFYHYGEDLDYAHRVQSYGLSIGFLNDVIGYHYREAVPLTREKSLKLKEAYHLAEAVNPLRQNRWWYSLGLPIAESFKSGRAYWKIALKIWKRRDEIRLWNNRPPLDLAGLQRANRLESLAPVLLLVYNRPEHTERVLRAYFQQPEAEQTDLFVYSDGAKNSIDQRKVDQVRAICKSYGVTIIEQPHNVGLAKNVIEGVTSVLAEYDRIIVLEDDLEISPYMLRWMNDSLNAYAENKEIAHLHTGTFYATPRLQGNHALRFVGSWGWATWRDRWTELWEPDGSKLLAELMSQPEEAKAFDYRGYMRFTRMLRHQIEGKNDSWAVRWHASLFLKHRLSVNSYPPLTSNCGFDGSGRHSGSGRSYRTAVSPYPIYASEDTPKVENRKARSVLQRYYARTNNKIAKGWYKLREILGI